jgi:hypothetical protein
MPSLTEIRFRSSPSVELRQLGELADAQRESFRDLETDPDFYGLFVPKPPLTINLKSAARQTAELFRSLATPSHLDRHALADADYATDVVDLVLDGILEVEHGDSFVFGAEALPLVCEEPAVPEARDAAAVLSREALQYAQDLETTDAHLLKNALYRYNRIPTSPFWKARFANGDAVLSHIGADRDPLRALLERDWIASRRMAGWMNWSSKLPMESRNGGITYKLYVSPRPERIRDAFEIFVRVMSDFPATQFKIGDDFTGLLRPDKLVAYFSTREQLDETADVLRNALAGCEAHGVPFTAGLDDTGLLSWGVDPPDDERALRWLGRESWRGWLADRLASALSVAKSTRGTAAVEPWRFAITRARRHGVDVRTWTPSATLWSRT